MRGFRRNKRGATPKAMEEVVSALVVLVFGILIMSFLSSYIEDQAINESESFINQAVVDNIVGVYLKQPVEVEGVEMTMADLIVLAFENERKYEDLLYSETEFFFCYVKGSRGKVYLQTPDDKKLLKGLRLYMDLDCSESGGPQKTDIFGTSTVYLPGYSKIIRIVISG